MACGFSNPVVLARALDEWQVLSEAEAAAIAADDWSALAHAQAGKARLQAEIDAARMGTETPPGSLPERASFLPPLFHPHIAQLIEMERRNLDSLTAKLEAQRRTRAELEATSRTLHHLRGSYGRRIEGAWESYS